MTEEKALNTSLNGHIELNGVDLVDLCVKFGTPLFVFDEKRFIDNYRRFHKAFSENYPKVAVCYSVKTNNNLAILNRIREEEAYAEVASSLDLYAALKAGFSPKRIILDGLYKPEELLRNAVRSELLLINVESFSELELLNQLAGEIGKRPTVGLRMSIYPRKFLNSEELYCNPLSRFGFPLEDGITVFKRALTFENLNIRGIMIHPYWGIHEFLPMANRILNELGIKFDFINFGGGFQKSVKKIGIPDLVKDVLRLKLGMRSNLDSPPKKARAIEEAARLIAEEVRETFGNDDSTLVFEPGRYLVHDAGYLIVQAGVVKEAAGFKWVVVDGGTNLVSDYLERRTILVANKANEPASTITNVVGPLLYGRDFITVKQRLPEIKEGDFLVLSNVGAYTLSSSTQFLYPRPRAVLIKTNGEVRVVREKETYEDVLRKDIV